MSTKSTRREFVKHSSLAGIAGLRPFGAPPILASTRNNETINVGFIGVGNRGTQLLTSFMKNSDVNVAALCDVFQPYVDRSKADIDRVLLDALGGRIPDLGQKFDNRTKKYSDFRRLLDQSDIDAVVIATPDHWHAIQMIDACDAGKDVYVEKPLSITIHEGRKMVEAEVRTKRVVQVGLHRRSSKLYSHAAGMVQKGTIGKVTVARTYRISNMVPDGIGSYPDSRPPANLDWDMWLGPREFRPYKHSITPYKFRWWQLYSSQIANWGVHYFDTIRWVVNQEAPISISAHGGKYALNDDRDIPDTMEAVFELPSGMLIVFGQYEASGGSALEYGEIEFRGTLGNLYTATEGEGYKIIPSRGGQFQSSKSYMEPFEQTQKMDGDLTDQHVRNFLDCVKSRETCNCPTEIGHRSTTFAHLANIALQTKSRLEWDAASETFTNNKEANQLLHYPYRKPWSLG